MVLVYSQSYTTIIIINFRIFSSFPKETPYLLAVIPHFPLNSRHIFPWQSLGFAYPGHLYKWNNLIYDGLWFTFLT